MPRGGPRTSRQRPPPRSVRPRAPRARRRRLVSKVPPPPRQLRRYHWSPPRRTTFHPPPFPGRRIPRHNRDAPGCPRSSRPIRGSVSLHFSRSRRQRTPRRPTRTRFPPHLPSLRRMVSSLAVSERRSSIWCNVRCPKAAWPRLPHAKISTRARPSIRPNPFRRVGPRSPSATIRHHLNRLASLRRLLSARTRPRPARDASKATPVNAARGETKWPAVVARALLPSLKVLPSRRSSPASPSRPNVSRPAPAQKPPATRAPPLPTCPHDRPGRLRRTWPSTAASLPGPRNVLWAPTLRAPPSMRRRPAWPRHPSPTPPRRLPRASPGSRTFKSRQGPPRRSRCLIRRPPIPACTPRRSETTPTFISTPEALARCPFTFACVTVSRIWKSRARPRARWTSVPRIFVGRSLAKASRSAASSRGRTRVRPVASSNPLRWSRPPTTTRPLEASTRTRRCTTTHRLHRPRRRRVPAGCRHPLRRRTVRRPSARGAAIGTRTAPTATIAALVPQPTPAPLRQRHPEAPRAAAVAFTSWPRRRNRCPHPSLASPPPPTSTRRAP